MAQRPRPTRSAQRIPPRRPTARPAYQARPRRDDRSGSPLWLVGIFAVILVVGYLAYDSTINALSDITRTKEVRPEQEVASNDSAAAPELLQRPFKVLLIGVDAREGAPEDGARSDTLIVVHVDPVAKWASMLSIPRDTFVSIPYRDDVAGGKITQAYSYGFSNPDIYGEGTQPDDAGAALAADTVEEFLGITIDYTAQVDFRGFQKLVDAIDGITVDVPRAILDPEYPTEDYGYMRLLIEPGLQRMDGATALHYARTRHVDSDFGRAARQQQVLQAALIELKGRGVLEQVEAVPQLLQALRESVKTTMPLADLGTLRGMAALAQEIGTDRIQRYSINPTTVALDERFDNSLDIHWDQTAVQQLAQEFEAGPARTVEAEETATIQVQNGRGIKGLAGQVSLNLEMAGFTVASPADAPTPDNPNTLILDYTGKPETRAKLAQFLGVDPEFVRDESANAGDAPLGVDIVVLVGADYDPPTETQSFAP